MASIINYRSQKENLLDKFSKSSIIEIKRLTDLLNKQKEVLTVNGI